MFGQLITNNTEISDAATPVKDQSPTLLALPTQVPGGEQERVNTACSWKSRIEEKRRARLNLDQNDDEGQKVESYRRVYRNDIFDQHEIEGEDHEIHDKYDELIPTDKLEAKKSKNDILNEIFDHKDQRILKNEQRLVDLRNK